MKRSMELCDINGCDGHVVVGSSRLSGAKSGARRIQRMRCNKCGKPHGKRVIEDPVLRKLAEIDERLKNLEKSASVGSL